MSVKIDLVAWAIGRSLNFHMYDPASKNMLEAAARAAIEAMREPSEPMVRAAIGEDRGPDHYYDHYPWFEAKWKAMIDAALK